MHELFTELISESSLSDQNELDSPKDTPYSESILLVNSTSANDINLGDIRKLMFIPDKVKATSNKKQESFSNEVTANGKTYRECSQYAIYYVTKSIRSRMHYLVDIISNGGVAGSDVRVIATHPDRKVDIRGINNYDITSIPLITAGGVTSTTPGKVIVSMHQHA